MKRNKCRRTHACRSPGTLRYVMEGPKLLHTSNSSPSTRCSTGNSKSNSIARSMRGQSCDRSLENNEPFSLSSARLPKGASRHPHSPKMATSAKAWRFDLNPGPGEAPKDLARPLGFNSGASIEDESAGGPSALAQANLKRKRAMEIAVGPGKNILMNGFMMYMSGAGINIFSIMITFMGIMNPVKAIVNVHSVFRSVDDGKNSLLMPKLIFAALNFLGVCVALWKMAKMGLLPVTAADWTSYLMPKHAIEHSGVPL